MRIGVLGAVAAWDATDGAVAIGGPRVRALLAQLALEAGRFVPAERLIDGLYGEKPPEGAANALQSQVSRLRNALKSVAPVEFTAAGYRLALEPDDVDVHRFARLAGDGRRELAAGDATRRATCSPRHWRCGGDRRSPTSPKRPSRQQRRRVSKYSAPTPPPTGSTPR